MLLSFLSQCRTSKQGYGCISLQVISAELERQPPMGGPGRVVQVDESLFRGRAKYNRGRRLGGNAIPGNRRNNYRNRVTGPWVFGMVDTETNELRLFHVLKRDSQTLGPIIARNVARGTIIMSDEWRAYRTVPTLCDGAGIGLNLVHKTVNHSVNFVDPLTRAHTQKIECAWKWTKLELLRKRCGNSGRFPQTQIGRQRRAQYLSGYLNWMWWLSLNGPVRCKDPFLRVIDLISRHYPQS